MKLAKRAERLADEAERKGRVPVAISAIRELSRLVALEASFYPQSVTGKLSVFDVQAMITAYNRGELETDEDEVAIEVEALPVPDDDEG